MEKKGFHYKPTTLSRSVATVCSPLMQKDEIATVASPGSFKYSFFELILHQTEQVISGRDTVLLKFGQSPVAGHQRDTPQHDDMTLTVMGRLGTIGEAPIRRETEMKKMAWVVTLLWMLILVHIPIAYGQSKEPPKEDVGQTAEAQLSDPLLDVVLVLDNSSSMKKNDPKFLTHEVVANFVKGLGAQSRLGMVIFYQQARLTEPLTELTNPEAKAAFLKSLDLVNYKGQFTDSPAGIERAI